MATALTAGVRVATPNMVHAPILMPMGTAATCTNNVATGFFFDATEVVEAGANATTTTCAPGLAGYATRACVWNGATSASGVWAAPVSFCQRTKGGAYGG
jgi:hypothetical protein